MRYSAQPSSNANAWVVSPRKEAAAQVYGTFVGSMSEIELYVAAEHEEAAKALVDEVIGKE